MNIQYWGNHIDLVIELINLIKFELQNNSEKLNYPKFNVKNSFNATLG